MERVFPTLTEIPAAISSHFQQMIDWLQYAVSQGRLPKFNNLDHVYLILDREGIVRCLFKSCQKDETSSMIESSVYLLDHPIDGHRSQSSSIKGFAGVLPTVFVKFRNADGKMEAGVLVEYKETVEDFHDYINGEQVNDGMTIDELHKICLTDLRFGNMDRNRDNIIVTLEDNTHHLVPIDHEMCFANYGQGYNLCRPYWLNLLEEGLRETFSAECVDYVANLNIDADIAFLNRCGWKLPAEYTERVKIFTAFLKKAVAQGLTLLLIGKMTSNKCIDERFNLEAMVRSVEVEFVDRVSNRIDERLLEYNEDM